MAEMGANERAYQQRMDLAYKNIEAGRRACGRSRRQAMEQEIVWHLPSLQPHQLSYVRQMVIEMASIEIPL